jgi:hypothetical protein
MKPLTFEEAIGKAEKVPHLFLGNGFSRACRNDIFAYDALFQRADFNQLSSQARKAFEVLQTTDFEFVMRSMRTAAALCGVYGGNDGDLRTRLMADADGLKEVLVNAIAGSHPERPSDISPTAYRACRTFLARFDKIYTVNYDLLLYWAFMQNELPPPLRCDDGFRTPKNGETDYVTWEPDNSFGNQNIHYLHGALHIFDAGAEIKKFTWVNTGVRLIEQIRTALHNDLYPLFVAEGESIQKLERIRHHEFLAKARRSFAQIGGPLFVYGHSFAQNDEHIIGLIGSNKVSALYVGLYGRPDLTGNAHIINRVRLLAANRHPKRPLAVEFFDSASAAVWG